MESPIPRSTTPTEDPPEALLNSKPAGLIHDVESMKVQVNGDKAPQPEKKKKKKKKPTKKKGTGFEEYFCDPPITPAEYSEERQVLYPPHRAFVDRIEECIQRYRARRRMDNERHNLFTEYLLLGGIDANPRQFQSTDKIGNDLLEEVDKTTVREMTADSVIQRGAGGQSNPRYFNPNEPEHWSVDFTGVAAGFLSEHIPSRMGGRNEETIRKGAEVVSNFLRYVEQHDVCPEYVDDVRKARKICDLAVEETSLINKLANLLPGHFNTCLRVRFIKESDLDDDEVLFTHIDENGNISEDGKPLIDPKVANLTFAIAVSIISPVHAQPAAQTVAKTTEYTYEVKAIRLPTDAIRAKYKAVNHHLAGSIPEFQPCGTMVAHPVIIRNGWDLSGGMDTIPAEEDVDTEFILEEEILRLLRVGMKLTLRVCTLSSGLKFIRQVKEILPSFYVFLPQELMLDFKAPVPNPRPGKSVHDADSEWDEEGDE